MVKYTETLTINFGRAYRNIVYTGKVYQITYMGKQYQNTVFNDKYCSD